MSLAATYRLGARLFWRDKPMLFASVVTPVGLSIGMPLLMRHVRADGPAAAAEMFPATLAIVLAITAFMNITVALTGRRDQLVLKRLRATELTDGQILAGQISSNATQTFLVIVACAVAVFLAAGVAPPPNVLVVALVVAAGSAVMALLGAAYTAAVPRAELAAAYTMPVFLVAGVSAGAMGPIPLPSWLRPALDLLPTSVVVDAVRTGEPLRAALVLAGWAVAGLVALRLWFRWEPRRS
ncbi:ABC transporter permease [Nonomuraea wenchangensis]|uniref:ABC-2 type transport system permease protein n=1 Tax=Nonomuraea wenchangensis TaxID=568860 RepID=A0A1I0A236_9ACTN|nr:ABC transporter permease [Nonomuraea wenchangensis]SES88184.1 ABC-2 type transport system permease protein [Nonomuraea wenchangensis]